MERNENWYLVKRPSGNGYYLHTGSKNRFTPLGAESPAQAKAAEDLASSTYHAGTRDLTDDELQRAQSEASVYCVECPADTVVAYVVMNGRTYYLDDSTGNALAASWPEQGGVPQPCGCPKLPDKTNM